MGKLKVWSEEKKGRSEEGKKEAEEEGRER